MSIRIYQSVNRIISPFRYNRMTDKKMTEFLWTVIRQSHARCR